MEDLPMSNAPIFKKKIEPLFKNSDDYSILKTIDRYVKTIIGRFWKWVKDRTVGVSIENGNSTSMYFYYEIEKKIKKYEIYFKIFIALLIIWFIYGLYQAYTYEKFVFVDAHGKKIEKGFGETETETLRLIEDYKYFGLLSRLNYKQVSQKDYDLGYVPAYING